MIRLTTADVSRALQAEVRPDQTLQSVEPFPQVSTDSRALQPGECFLAIRGDRFDGHDFIEESLAKGASAVIHSTPLEHLRTDARWSDRIFLQVADTTRGLQDLAQYVRKRWGGRLVAITGSMGKTTTRSFAARVLAEKFAVLESPGNLNNEFGVPLSLLGLEPEHQIAILELGMNHAGEIRRLSEICRPDIALITNVAAVHLEFFSGLAGIAAAKGEILESLAPGGQFLFNADDPFVHSLARDFQGRRISFSVGGNADVQVNRIVMERLDRMQLHLSIWGQPVKADLPFAGRHFAANAAAAAAVGLSCGMSLQEIESGLASLQPLERRGQALELPVGEGAATVLDDTYNSNPQAVEIQLQTMSMATGYTRKLAALGEMLELGGSAPELHRQVGRTAARAGIEILITVGDLARFIEQGAQEASFKGTHLHFDSAEAAGAWITPELKAGDLLLCKGSRAVRMDRIVTALRAGKEIPQP